VPDRGLGAAGADIAARYPATGQAPAGVNVAGGSYEVCRDADALVVLTEWREFPDADLTKVAGLLRGDVVVDLRNCLSTTDCTAAGLRYVGVGRSAS